MISQEQVCFYIPFFNDFQSTRLTGHYPNQVDISKINNLNFSSYISNISANKKMMIQDCVMLEIETCTHTVQYTPTFKNWNKKFS